MMEFTRKGANVRAKKRAFLIFALSFVLVFESFAAGSQEGGTQEVTKAEFVLKAQGTGPLGDEVFDRLYLGFKEKVEERSGGRIQVDFYPSQSFAPDREYLEMMGQGIVDVYMGSALTMGLFDPKWNILYLPFIFDDRDEMYAFLDGAPGQALAESLLASHGIRVITWADSGHRSFSNSKRPLRVPQDARGMRMRSPETVPLEDWMKTLGIDPVVLSFPEMAPALQQGVVDGQDIELASGKMLNLHEVQKYWTTLVHLYVPVPVSISEKTWQKLPEDLRLIVEEALIESAQEARAAFTETFEVQKIKSFAEAEGLILVEPTAAEKQLWVNSAKPIYKNYVSLIGEETMNMAFDFLGKSWK